MAIILLILLSPLSLFIGLVIYLEDGFPILFIQKRVGLNGKEFTFYKFRTMKRNTPIIETAKLDNSDLWVLRSGRTFRKLSFDEIPNLLNIIKGDINFVGYRPALKSQVILNRIRNSYGIYESKPGVTGLAQVKGRDILSDECKLKYEKFYLTKASNKLNFYIFYLTILSIFQNKSVKH